MGNNQQRKTFITSMIEDKRRLINKLRTMREGGKYLVGFFEGKNRLIISEVEIQGHDLMFVCSPIEDLKICRFTLSYSIPDENIITFTNPNHRE